MRGPRGEPSSAHGGDVDAAHGGGEPLRLADGGRRADEHRIGAVVQRQATEPPQELGDVAAEHATERVQLVDDDVAEPAEEGGPPLVVREEPRVEHLRVREHHRGVLAHPRALLGAGVAVVGAGPDPGQVEGGEGAQLIVGEGLGGEQDQSGAGSDRRRRGLRDRHLVAERLARRGAGGDHHRPSGPGEVDGLGLVRPQRTRQPRRHLGGQRAGQRTEAGRSGRERGEVHEAAGTEVGADPGVGVVGAVALRGQLAEPVGDARPRREGVEVVGADGHGARRAYARAAAR